MQYIEMVPSQYRCGFEGIARDNHFPVRVFVDWVLAGFIVDKDKA